MAALVCLLMILPASIAAVCSFLLTIIGRIGSPSRERGHTAREHRIAVLIPAHNEEVDLACTLASVMKAGAHRTGFRVIVVADNCTDQTAHVARKSGAEVLVRTDSTRRGKGYALAYGIASILKTDAEAILVLDADCEVSPGLLSAFDLALESGAKVVQSVVTSVNPDDGVGGYIAAIGTAIDRGIALGLQRLARPVPLRGTGMLLHRDALARCPWTTTGLAEDAEYAAQLRSAGIPVHYLGTESVQCRAPLQTQALLLQRRRWRAALRVGGHRGLARVFTSKPLVLLHLIATLVLVLVLRVAFPADVPNFLVGWVLFIAGMIGFIYGSAIRQVGLTPTRWIMLLRTPLIVVQLAWVTLGSFFHARGVWTRTPRNPV